MTTLADDATAILESSVLNSFGNDPGNGLGSTSIIPTLHQADKKCCVWLVYLSFFLVSCVIMWAIITSLVVGFHVYRRSNTMSSLVQRCIKKRRKKDNPATNIQIEYHQPIQYDIAQVPLFKSEDEYGVGGQKGWFGSSMKDYILHRPPAPICPNLEMGPKKSETRISGSEEKRLFDRRHPLWTYFSDEDVTNANIESQDCNVGDNLGDDDERTLTEQEWGNNFKCKLTMIDLVQPTDKTPLKHENIDSNKFLVSSNR